MKIAHALLPMLLAPVIVQLSGCVGASRSEEAMLDRLSDVQLWQRSLQLRGKAEEALRCQGLSSKARQASFQRQFGARVAQVRAAVFAKYGPIDDAVLPVGYRCPFAEGGQEEYERLLRLLERRLLVVTHQTVRSD
jgi:hypothetical protein